MNVLARSKASQGGGNERIDLGLDRNDLNAGICKKSVFSDPGAPLIGLSLSHFRSSRLISFSDPDHLIEVTQLEHRREFARSVRMLRSNLPRLDGSPCWILRECQMG